MIWYADFTLTIRLSQSVFVPLEIKYDPKGKLFGFLNVKWDLTTVTGKSK
jgi:hypothetical protein